MSIYELKINSRPHLLYEIRPSHGTKSLKDILDMLPCFTVCSLTAIKHHYVIEGIIHL